MGYKVSLQQVRCQQRWQVRADEFTSMWATPANVDLKGLCRAHRVPFQRVTDLPGLLPALRSAWNLNSPSVVEVITDRTLNVAAHRHIEAACTAAARQALLCSTLPQIPRALPLRGTAASGVESMAHASAAPSEARAVGSETTTTQPLVVRSVRLVAYHLPLTAQLTTGTSANDGRRGGILHLVLESSAAADNTGNEVAGSVGATFNGTGDVAPLPLLHQESFTEARAQVEALALLLQGCSVPSKMATLDGGFGEWWEGTVGVSVASIFPSVCFAVECAIVEALARSCGRSFASHLFSCALPAPQSLANEWADMSSWQGSATESGASVVGGVEQGVLVNALLDITGLLPKEAVARAQLLWSEGFRTIKVKVCPHLSCKLSVLRRWYLCVAGHESHVRTLFIDRKKSSVQIESTAVQVGRSREPIRDARVLASIQEALGCAVVLRADANREFSLQEALAFAQQLHLDSVDLDYIEEPVASPQANLATFVAETGLPVALDESLVEGLVHTQVLGLRESGAALPLDGVVALVIKPSVIGSLERCCALVRWAHMRGMRCTISSAFESSVGLCKLAALAAVVDRSEVLTPSVQLPSPDVPPSASLSTDVPSCSSNQHTSTGDNRRPWRQHTSAHGLGTLEWFAHDYLSPGLNVTDIARSAPLATWNGHSESDESFSGRRTALAGFALADVASVESAALSWVSSSPPLPHSIAAKEEGFSVAKLAVHVPKGDTAHGAYYMAHVLCCELDRVAAARSDALQSAAAPAVLFLHGFMGVAQDWHVVMTAMRALGFECAAVDFPGHGATRLVSSQYDLGSSDREGVRGGATEGADLEHMHMFVLQVVRALGWGARRCTLVGYSLGARVALQVAGVEGQEMVGRVVSVSGSPGIEGVGDALSRVQKDAQMAAALRGMVLHEFLDLWYRSSLWGTLREHPKFHEVLESRMRDSNVCSLAHVLEQCSPGRQNLWEKLKGHSMGCQVAFVVGGRDGRFVGVARAIVGMTEAVTSTVGPVFMWPCEGPYPVAEVVAAGHAVHIEQPLALVQALHALLRPEDAPNALRNL
jgi:isochorismate synthase / 2-succinyl-5-enolpyruvyl-6-hydroxy-3-cyclohexene-1-carboxylate synthase / 2-succinyl-6-hydroxy-2,4-cyclohexadiene-1-carboxylate synthase / o-succinylbenzoate synthase